MNMRDAQTLEAVDAGNGQRSESTMIAHDVIDLASVGSGVITDPAAKP
jgi:hypothetical protein